MQLDQNKQVIQANARNEQEPKKQTTLHGENTSFHTLFRLELRNEGKQIISFQNGIKKSIKQPKKTDEVGNDRSQNYNRSASNLQHVSLTDVIRQKTLQANANQNSDKRQNDILRIKLNLQQYQQSQENPVKKNIPKEEAQKQENSEQAYAKSEAQRAVKMLSVSNIKSFLNNSPTANEKGERQQQKFEVRKRNHEQTEQEAIHQPRKKIKPCNQIEQEKPKDDSQKNRKITTEKSHELYKSMIKAIENRTEREDLLKTSLLRYVDRLSEKSNNHQKQQMMEMVSTVSKVKKNRENKVESRLKKKSKYAEQSTSNTNAQCEKQSKFRLQKYKSINEQDKEDGNEGHKNLSLFYNISRYKQCDVFFSQQKRNSLRNIFRKEQGLVLEKKKVKIVEIYDQFILDTELANVKRLHTQTEIDKLDMLLKIDYGWLAIGKNSTHGLFMVDVNLLTDRTWKILEEIYHQ